MKNVIKKTLLITIPILLLGCFGYEYYRNNKRLELRINEMNWDIESLQQELDDATGEIYSLRYELEEAKGEISQLKSDVDWLEIVSRW